MFDLVDLLWMLDASYSNALVCLSLIAVCFWVLSWKKPFKVKMGALSVCLLGIILVGRPMYVENYLIMLGEESDDEAELAFNILRNHLSDRELVRILSEGRKDKNEQFYVALLAAQRGMHVPDSKPILAPAFFGTNSYSGFGRSLHYPTSYEDFLHEYQIVAESKKGK